MVHFFVSGVYIMRTETDTYTTFVVVPWLSARVELYLVGSYG